MGRNKKKVSASAANSGFDIGKYLREHIPTGDWVELATVDVDGVDVTVRCVWSQIVLRDPEGATKDLCNMEVVYDSNRLMEEVTVGRTTVLLDESTGAFKDLLQWQWWDKRLRPLVEVNLLKGVVTLLVHQEDTNKQDDGCYVCHDRHGDARLKCKHKICTPCFLKSLDDDAECTNNFKCGVCRSEESFEGL